MKYFILFTFSIIIAFNCKSAKEKYDDKNFTGAFDEALSNVKKNKDKRDNLAVLKKSLKQIVVKYTTLKSRLNDVIDPEEKAPLADANIDLLNRLDAASDFIIPDSFYKYNTLLTENKNLRNEVGNHYKFNAIELIDKAIDLRRKSFAQDAYDDVIKAEKYLGTSNELSKLKDESIKYGTVVSNINMQHWTTDFSSFDVDRLFQRLENTTDRFYKIYYEKNFLRSELDCDIQLEIESIDYRQSSQSNIRTFTEKIIDRYDVIVDANGDKKEVPVYKEIRGNVEIATITLRASTDIYLNVNQITEDCQYRNDRWSRMVETTGEEYRLSGDQRAIPNQYKSNSMSNIKTRDRLKEELLEELFDAVRNELD